MIELMSVPTESLLVAPDDNVQDSMEVFSAWGPHIRQFAMAFEVTEGKLDNSIRTWLSIVMALILDEIANLPSKSKFMDTETYWGRFVWPHREYARYNSCATLETKADEFRCMSAALSNLTGLQELGLCIDSGLGWLAGPDISDRAQLFQQKHGIFGVRAAEAEDRSRSNKEAWDNAVDWLSTSPPPADSTTSSPPSAASTTSNLSASRPLIFWGINISDGPDSNTPCSFDLQDILQRNSNRSNFTRDPFSAVPVIPNRLTVAQKEWLLEIEWAQRAFLSSYCMALIDNSQTFQNVHSLNIAKLSSKHLADLQRKDIWQALPNLNDLTIIVVADFRIIHKDDSGNVQATDIKPSKAATSFFTLLQTMIADIQSIKIMKLGYFGGGEHQSGIFGRNNFVLPAPLVDFTKKQVFAQDYQGVLHLPYVENLTLVNCWIAPTTLKKFADVLVCGQLRLLTFDSVSLTTHFDTENTPPLDISKSPQRGTSRPAGFNLPSSFFLQRAPSLGSFLYTTTSSWIEEGVRVGSWSNIIDTISPGPTLDLVRHAFHYQDEAPMPRSRRSLEVIDFISCGYVSLSNAPTTSRSLPRCLYKRAFELAPIIMHRSNDELLGQIAPYDLGEMESGAMATGFPMTMGWGDDERKYDNLEDGQLEGGSGRFSGRVEKLVPDYGA